MAAKTVIRVADSTLYHLSPKGFWKKFRDAVVVDPEISSGLPKQGVFRYPQPGSRPELYSTPATMASDIAENAYWKRDVRRAYPRLSVVTQSELSGFLIEHSTPQVVSAPVAEGETAVAPTPKPAVDLTSAIATIAAEKPVFSVSNLPPSISVAHKVWVPELAEPAPHDPDSYFPMHLYK